MYGEPLKEPVPVAAQDTTLPQPSWMAPMPDAARLSNVPSWMPPNRDLSGPSAVGEDVPVAPDFGMAYAGQDGVIPPASTSTGTNFFAGATAPAAPTGTSSGMVRVIAPNGKPGRIPASQVPAALSAGYRLAVVNVTSN